MTSTKRCIHLFEGFIHFTKKTGQNAHSPGKISSLNQILLPLVASSTLFKPFQVKTMENNIPNKI